ncbi:MAG: hypothetical protein R3324_14860 [Halobacteriales archaeon]|nr:hypothetical protein [Halobacteriales archaeon]
MTFPGADRERGNRLGASLLVVIRWTIVVGDAGITWSSCPVGIGSITRRPGRFGRRRTAHERASR